jgi:signal transduction histidine kinase
MNRKAITPEYLASLEREELERMLLDIYQNDPDFNNIEYRYRTLFDSIDEGFCIAGVLFDEHGKAVDYRFLEINSAFERQIGVKNAQGRRIREFSPNLEQSWFEYFARVARNGESFRFQNYASELGRWFDVYSFPFGRPGDNHIGIIFSDITAQRRAEEALKQSEQRFRALATAGSDMIYSLSPDWEEIRMLEGKNLIAEPSEPVADWRKHFIPGEDLEMVNQVMAAAIQGKKIFDLEHRVHTKDGNIGWVHSRAVPIFDDKGNIREWFGAAIDISDRKKSQQIQARAQALETANKELESFSYSVSHDLRSPVTTIQGYTQILMEEHSHQLDAEAQKYLQAIKTGAQKMSNIIDFLMLLSKTSQKEMKRQDIHIDHIAREVIDELALEMPRPELRVDIQQELHAFADPDLVKILLTNLFSNALKFTSKTSSPQVMVGKHNDEFFVSDNGVGFNSRYAEKIFSTFKRAHDETDFPGQGIGLAIVQRIIRRHGGSIRAEAQEGKGATFYFKLQ